MRVAFDNLRPVYVEKVLKKYPALNGVTAFQKSRGNMVLIYAGTRMSKGDRHSGPPQGAKQGKVVGLAWFCRLAGVMRRTDFARGVRTGEV